MNAFRFRAFVNITRRISPLNAPSYLYSQEVGSNHKTRAAAEARVKYFLQQLPIDYKDLTIHASGVREI